LVIITAGDVGPEPRLQRVEIDAAAAVAGMFSTR
jgi:hypothetical protein